MTFAEKLKELRQACGLSQTGLASASGIPVGTIRDYEQGKRDPLLSNAQRLAKALRVSLDEFPPVPGPSARKPAARVSATSPMKKTRSKK
jgi:transcriptional regulator with XRE-family HTH domain